MLFLFFSFLFSIIEYDFFSLLVENVESNEKRKKNFFFLFSSNLACDQIISYHIIIDFFLYNIIKT